MTEEWIQRQDAKTRRRKAKPVRAGILARNGGCGQMIWCCSRQRGRSLHYAIKSSYLLSFLESVPEVSAKLKEPRTAEMKFEDVVKDAEQAAVLVLVY